MKSRLPFVTVHASQSTLRARNCGGLCPALHIKRNEAVSVSRVSRPVIRRSTAFTVLEILVATAILMVLASLLFTVFNKASDAWIYGETTVDRQRTARTATEILNRELSQAFITTNAAGRINFVGGTNWVYFVAPVAPFAGMVSDLGEFGYRHDPATMQFTRGYSAPSTANISPNPVKWDTSRTTINETTTTNLASLSIVAENVVSASLTYYDQSGGSSSTWDSRAGAGQDGRLPSVVEFSMLVIDSRTARNIPSSGSARDDYLLRNARTNNAVIHLIQAQ